MGGVPLTVTGLGTLLASVALFITVSANELLGLGALLGSVAFLTTIMASATTTTLRAVTRKVTDWNEVSRGSLN